MSATIRLVHGAWHGPWAWEPLVEALGGIDVRTVALPSTGPDPTDLGDLQDDARAVRAALAAIDDPLVVVAHSYGGAPVTEAVTADSGVSQPRAVAGILRRIADAAG